MDKFEGVPYPITKDSKGYFRKQGGVNQIKSDLLILLLTNPGERIMLPTFGTPLRTLIFGQNDAVLAQRAREMIITAIREWEPRVAIQNIIVLTEADKNSLSRLDDLSNFDNIMMIRITFVDPENIQEIQELRLEVPLQS